MLCLSNYLNSYSLRKELFCACKSNGKDMEFVTLKTAGLHLY